MKNYGLQVKEIPIIFRGTIDGATPATGMLFYSGSVTPNQEAPGGAYSDLVQPVNKITTDYNSLTITVDGVKYENVEITYFEDYSLVRGEAGAPYITNDFVFDDSTYPFCVTFAIEEYQGLQIYFKDRNEHSIVVEAEGEEEKQAKKIFAADLTGNGQVNHFRARFACGENGTLHLKPYVILNGNIRVDLCNFAQGGDQYIAGDNEEIEFDCYVPIETHAVAYVEAENIGEYPSLVDAAMTVQYEDFVESESIVGYEGVNLRRGRR